MFLTTIIMGKDKMPVQVGYNPLQIPQTQSDFPTALPYIAKVIHY